MPRHHIAQVNIARMKAPLDSPVMAGFVARLEEINALWCVPAGHTPGIDEAKKRLAHLDERGPSQFAFTFKTVQPPDESFLASFDWSVFRPCPAT